MTKLVLVNTLYFKEDWETKFDTTDTYYQPFILESENNQTDVITMHILMVKIGLETLINLTPAF